MTKEEILGNHELADVFTEYYSKARVLNSMQFYADQEKRKQAIAFAEWIVDNDWYQNQANEWIKRGDLAEYISTSELHERYLQSLTQHVSNDGPKESK